MQFSGREGLSEVVRLTTPKSDGKLNLMPCLTFAARTVARSRLLAVHGRRGVLAGAAFLAPETAHGQRVPGRDLLEFPIGTVAEAPALATDARIGVWNPATIAATDARAAFGVAALATPADQGVAAQAAGVGVRIQGGATIALSVVRASVRDLLLTDGDPRSLGEVRYATTLVSAMAARPSGRHLVSGLAVRYRTGELGTTTRGAVALDGGVLVRGLGSRDARLAVSSFLWSPANQQEERATFTGAGDLRLSGPDSTYEVRTGYSYAATERGLHEHFAFVSGRRGILQGRGGLARSQTFDDARWRLRLGVGVYYARYAVAVSREESGAGLGAIYQFSLSSTVR